MENKYICKIAETDEEKLAAYKLRYNELVYAFNDKLDPNGIDKCDYDNYAKMLIVKDIENSEIVGTYRLVDIVDLPNGEELRCEREFDITSLRNSKDKIIEISRAVVKSDERNGSVLKILVKGLIEYILNNNYRFAIGDASFVGLGKEKYVEEFSYLVKNFPMSKEFLIKSKDKKQIKLLSEDKLSKEVYRKLPPLIRMYAMMGAWFCDEMFEDIEFNSTDVFVVLDTKNMNNSFIERFLK